MISINTTIAENKKRLRIRVWFFTNFWLQIRVRKNAQSFRSRLRHSGSVATSAAPTLEMHFFRERKLQGVICRSSNWSGNQVLVITTPRHYTSKSLLDELIIIRQSVNQILNGIHIMSTLINSWHNATPSKNIIVLKTCFSHIAIQFFYVWRREQRQQNLLRKPDAFGKNCSYKLQCYDFAFCLLAKQLLALPRTSLCNLWSQFRQASCFFSHRQKRFWNDRKKLSHFGQNVWKYRLKNTFRVSFKTTILQMTEIF